MSANGLVFFVFVAWSRLNFSAMLKTIGFKYSYLVEEELGSESGCWQELVLKRSGVVEGCCR